MIEFYIPGNIPSVKNSKIKNRYPSKVVQKWLRLYGIQSYNSKTKEIKYFKTIPKKHDFYNTCEVLKTQKKYPIVIYLHYIRDSKRQFDFINACQVLFDLWTAMDLIPDDSMDYIIPVPLKIDEKWYSYNKGDGGVIVRV